MGSDGDRIELPDDRTGLGGDRKEFGGVGDLIISHDLAKLIRQKTTSKGKPPAACLNYRMFLTRSLGIPYGIQLIKTQKKPSPKGDGLCPATSYSHRGKPPTTIGAEELNFRVR
ncbi:hypothetical protein, partial [Sporosarcina cyprini]|uniref:hypothetical protein n=1 Tax=Sporosarcina cyprini TaxID=2910523 RepID=UPI001EDD37DA